MSEVGERLSNLAVEDLGAVKRRVGLQVVEQPLMSSDGDHVSVRQPWRRAYSRRLAVGDLLVLGASVGAAHVARFGFGEAPLVNGVTLTYTWVGALLALGWWFSLSISRARDTRVVGHGTEEYRRVVEATFRAFAVMTMLAVAFKVDASRLYLAIAFPLGLLGLLVARKLARLSLHRRRLRGHAMADVLVVGNPRAAADVANWFRRHPVVGYRVSGAWVIDADTDTEEQDPTVKLAMADTPIMPQSTGLAEALERTGAVAVLVTDTELLGHERLRELTWQLEGTGVDLMLSPNVLDIASSRLQLDDVAGMPLLHVEEPQYAGASRLSKTLFDRIGASLMVLAFSPVLIATALAVKLTSAGPIFYQQTRVGLAGQDFGMIKFRSMRVGADAELADLLAAEGKTLAELPKLTRDPRVTKVGAFIRRFSIDELPQLFNVVKGDMSLVGPRPQRHFEVEQYDHVATRRLTVRPGMTGLWQVSGRSDLSYEEAIRLDVHYVENWSMTSDLVILWRTARAVLGSDGAY